MSDDQQMTLAIVRDYGELHAALRARADELQVTRKQLDDLSGLQDGYSAKLLAENPIKYLGPVSLGLMLAGLAVKLVLVHDDEAATRLKKRIDPRAANHVRGRKLHHYGRMLAQARAAKLTSEARSHIARLAAKARWRKQKSNETKAQAAS